MCVLEGSLVYTAHKWLLFLPAACALQSSCGLNPPWSPNQSYTAQGAGITATYSAYHLPADAGIDGLQL